VLRPKTGLVKFLPILFIIFLGGFFRFYKLNWGNNFFFHPDEYHIVAAVDRLSFPTNLNPELFSYGSLTVYLIYFSRFLLSLFNPSFKNLNPFLIGRFFSAFFSTLTIINVYLISKRLFKNEKIILISTFLTSLIPGLIQQAHFATPESTLSFFLTLSVYLWIRWIDERKMWIIFLSAISLGFATATKITGALILPILFVLPFVPGKNFIKYFLKNLRMSFFLFGTFFISFFLAFPYSILDFPELRNSMNYEGSVAFGKLVVFYTRQFINTKPFIFQFTKILPFSLGWGVLIFSTLGLIIIVVRVLTNFIERKSINYKLLILLLSFLFFFVPNSVLFTKWTRFINPTFPTFCIFGTFFIQEISNIPKSTKMKNILTSITELIILIPTLIWSLMFFSVYTNGDVRVTSDGWINKNVPKGSLILTETGNMLEVPLTGNYRKISFDFYNLENDSRLQNQLVQYLSSSDYFIVQSRRIFINHQRLANQFPLTSNFYDLLFSEKLGFEKIEEFDSFPKLGNWEINDESAEETWSVFDHPVIRIYKKVNFYPINYYAQILKI
jgi:hypothetical protein